MSKEYRIFGGSDTPTAELVTFGGIEDITVEGLVPIYETDAKIILAFLLEKVPTGTIRELKKII